uniref:MgtC/SapB/SrpB/YhiD N-terminal domain-containing protein n=1 Tax=Rhodosorus marinus TaxID=101924 RepID=A0A7S2ZBM3_9RHOD|mmetsp:Transcript_12213/g.50506  ORF Transcript_12213/g.50506 Transcript_12213/m.50506 type:complete len:271 (+) Transcript_12213:66-878(+)
MNFIQRLWDRFKSNFRHNPDKDALIYLSVVAVAVVLSLVCILEPVLVPECDRPSPTFFPFKNLKYDDSPCRRLRYGVLLWLTPMDADIGRRMLVAIVLAALIGYERRSPERAAGVRTMSVTSLGACCFTISSIFAFESGTMDWDASRVTAAIPSGVGFLGSAIIWKGMVGDGDDKHHEVSGISTAASVWISASIGVAAGGALFYTALFTSLCVILILRFGPMTEDERECAKVETLQFVKTETSPLLGRVDELKLEDARVSRRIISISSHT